MSRLIHDILLLQAVVGCFLSFTVYVLTKGVLKLGKTDETQ